MSIKNISALRESIERAAEVLPAQSPLHAFVHHNTLHAYEGLIFKEGLRKASHELGAEPFMEETKYLEALNSGRILISDIEAVLSNELLDPDEPVFPGAPTRRAVLMWRLTSLFNVPNKSSVNWWLHEKGYLHHAHSLVGSAASSPGSSQFIHSKRKYLPGEIKRLWENLERAAPLKEKRIISARPRDIILDGFDFDTDDLVKPQLVRLAGSYLDQGVGGYVLPDRDKGFWHSFINQFSIKGTLLPVWLSGLPEDCRSKLAAKESALDTIASVLQFFKVDEPHQDIFFKETLKMLKGWAGMFRQFEKSPGNVPVNAYPATLVDFLAVQLLLEKYAYQYASAKFHFPRKFFHSVMQRIGPETVESAKSVQDIYEGFVTAQAFDLPGRVFSDTQNASRWISEIGRFDSFERRYLLQLAYERRHRHHVLDGLIEHQKFSRGDTVKQQASFQAVFCMDEREESTRRHLEEISPNVQTLGFAGFFGVAMQYQGLDDVAPRPLCPVNRVPEHFVYEVAIDEADAKRYQKFRRVQAEYSVQVMRNEAVISIGPLWSLVLGIAKTPSLILRSLFPKFTERTKKKLLSYSPSRPATRLKLFREGDAKTTTGLYLGYTVEEAATVVEGMLAAMGLTANFSPIVLIVGHGSSSLNNPHEAAHDCGATGGGRGGPNARAFAAMANHPKVREILAQKSIQIPPETWFVGAYHNTCDDGIDYYDEDLIPELLLSKLDEIKTTMARACAMDALERCRKFAEVPVDITSDEAMDYAFQHSIDLAQPRPEYGHATNAICIIGRRGKTRGLFLDRRAFLISYDPEQDPDKSIIAGILESAGPVGAGINLEYYFSYIDPIAYGCGTKLPHNISGLVGVMEGQCSDLRTGLPWQMVEIHEPVRLLTIVEAAPEDLLRIAEDSEVVGTLVGNEWIQLISLHPKTGVVKVFEKGEFVEYKPQQIGFPVNENSENHFRGISSYLGLAHIERPVYGESNV